MLDYQEQALIYRSNTMRYTYSNNIPWQQYASWYRDINDNEKQELNDALSQAAKLGLTSYTQYKAEQQKMDEQDELEKLYKAAGIMNEDGTWNKDMDMDKLMNRMLIIKTFGTLVG